MQLKVGFHEDCATEMDVDLARFEYDEKTLHIEFAKIITSERREFISKLFSNETTLYVLSDENADDICVITSEPSTENIYEYCVDYSKILTAGLDSFEFMVHGVCEIEDSEFGIKITKDDWYAFS